MEGRATKKLAMRVVRRLREAGHEALLAGGCVRDMLMGRRPADYDVATSATPDQVKRLFRRVLMVGAKFGVAMVLDHKRRVEVATFRSDLSYSDGRRPDGVKFTSAKEDAVRRDFTINGMFYNPLADEVVDYVGGREDLSAGVIRAIGDPQRRFSEDYLRMLRAARFAARFAFRIDPATAAAIRRHAGRIARISGERIREELEKMFAHRSAGRAVKEMYRLGLLGAVLPELAGEEARLSAAVRRVEALAGRGDKLLTLAALTCELPAGEIRKVLRRWGGSNAARDSLIWLAGHLHDWGTLPEAPLAGLKRVVAHRDFERLEALSRLDERAATGGNAGWRRIRGRVRGIPPRRINPAPLLTGEDLKKLGVPEGPRIGRVLEAVREAQLNEQVRSRRQALEMARGMMA